jgi:large subunit ribosomal protein L18
MKRKIRDPKREQWLKRRTRVLHRLERSQRTRLTVFRSSRHIYAQLVDPVSGRTIASASTRSEAVIGKQAPGSKVEAAQRVGKAIAELARRHQIEEVVFNRNGFLFHGRVKALADAARESGLRF